MAERRDRFETRAIHVGQSADPATGSTIVPVHQTMTYTQERLGEDRGFVYSRSDNPTRRALEEALASLEEGSAAQVLYAPRHPYTAELLAAVPTLDR